MLEVTIWASLDEDTPQVFSDIDYVSLVSDETYGPPALIAPKPGAVQGRIGDRVLFLNTRFVPMFEIVRTSD